MGLFGKPKPKGHFVPNLWGHVIWTTAEEVLGSQEFGSLQQRLAEGGQLRAAPPNNMKKEFSFMQVSETCAFIREKLGNRRAEEFGLKVGNQLIQENINLFKNVAMAATMATKFGTLDGKVKLALEFFSKYISSTSDEVIVTGADQGSWTWTLVSCPYCLEKHESQPICHITTGMVQGILKWVSPETTFQVSEDECIAAGGRNCVIRISKSAF